MDYLSLCLICKDENDYLPEWLDYHILMGVDRFYIYDNESQTSLRETLKEYIEGGWVVVVNIPGKAMQLYAYDHCLRTFGRNTFWMGFIDADEFLVPKTAPGLKELLKDYETYGGLAVNSIFFGSNGYQTRPAIGQVAAYTKSTHVIFLENDLVKSIVQPGLALMPNSPHDFTFKEGTWCVNEDFLRVDGQRFPNRTDKIQLNHYYCRSESEIDLKLRRGNSGNIVWPRKRFDLVNQFATYEDTSILPNLNELFQDKAIMAVARPQEAELLEKMATLARTRRTSPLEITRSENSPLNFRTEISDWMDLKAQGMAVKDRGDFYQLSKILLSLIQMQPQYPHMYIDLSNNYLHIGNPEAAWQALSQAWQLAPNTYAVHVGMALYFLHIKNYSMAEKTCHVLLEIAPHNLTVLGFLTQTLIGQERFEEALKVGVPVVELSAQTGELPDGMGIFLIKRMADHLLGEKDYDGAVRLWKIGVEIQPGETTTLLELANSMLLTGDKAGAQEALTKAQALSPQNESVRTLQKQVLFSPNR
jgi:tetratricopeptide (TPR) repeat protein